MPLSSLLRLVDTQGAVDTDLARISHTFFQNKREAADFLSFPYFGETLRVALPPNLRDAAPEPDDTPAEPALL